MTRYFMSRWTRRTQRRQSAITTATGHGPNVWGAMNMPVVRGSGTMTNDQATTGETTNIPEAEDEATVGKAVVVDTEATIKVEAITTKVVTEVHRAATNPTTNPHPTILTDATAVVAADTDNNHRTVVTKEAATATTTTNHTAPITTTNRSGAAITAASTPTNSNNNGDNGAVTITTATVTTATATTTEAAVVTVTRRHVFKSHEDFLTVALFSGAWVSRMCHVVTSTAPFLNKSE